MNPNIQKDVRKESRNIVRENLEIVVMADKSKKSTPKTLNIAKRFFSREVELITPWKKYSNRINYSSCNEDSNSEIKALGPIKGSRLLCITAGGGRVLNLLAEEPSEIWAVDVNIWQNYLLELKIAALRNLGYDDFLSFIGDKPCKNRIELYEHIKTDLSLPARDFFKSRVRLIKKGILLQGNLEKFFGITSKILGTLWVKNRNTLFNFKNLEDQKEFLAKNWDSSFWKFLAKTLCHETFLKIFADDPGFMRFLPDGLSVNNKIFDCLHRYLQNNLANNNPLLSLIFFGRYISDTARPIYLMKEPFIKIKSALNNTKIKIITGLIGEILMDVPAETFDGFSISDIASYMSDKVLDFHVQEILRTAKPKARICMRHCLSKRELIEKYSWNVKRNFDLENELAVRDHAMVHEFTIGEII